MLKYFFLFILLIHGLIHFMGFAKGFGYGNITQLTKYISKPTGLLWLFTTLLCIVSLILFLLKNISWPYFAIAAVILSQLLIIDSWKDARFGSLANIIILLVAIAAFSSQVFESQFKKDVKKSLARTINLQTDLLKEVDIQFLPLPVQKYLYYTGSVNKPKVKNARFVFEGEMRSKKGDWFAFNVLQYNFFDESTRLFFMKGKMFGIIVPGYHDYQYATARMNVKLFGLFPLVKESGLNMNIAETVTLFNDMCLMVPATLIDKRIEWQAIDSLSAQASFTNGSNKIKAMLYFNELGQLVNFVSDDRFDVNEKKKCRFSTPVKKYMQMNGRNIINYGEAVWHYPEGEFVYGKFNLKSIEYNVTEFKP